MRSAPALEVIPNDQPEETPIDKVKNLLTQLKGEMPEEFSRPSLQKVEDAFEALEGMVPDNGQPADADKLKEILALELEGVRLRIFPILRKLYYVNKIRELLGEAPIDFFGEQEDN